MRLAGAVAFALVGCAGPSTDTSDTNGGDTDVPAGLWPVPALGSCPANDGGSCIDHVQWSDACATDPAPVTHDGLVYTGALGDYEQPVVEVVTDAVRWDALLDGASADRVVDFGTEKVIVLRWDISSTCGARLTQHGTGSDGSVRMAVEDPSGTCDEVCDMFQTLGVAYAVPTSADPTVCVAIVNSCVP